MKKRTWLGLAVGLGLLASSPSRAGKAELDPGPGPLLAGVAQLDCTAADPLTCGEFRRHAVDGDGSVTTYGCTGLEYDGAAEFVYELCVGGEGAVTLEMTYMHQTGINDLDLFLLGSCDEADCLDSSLDVTGTEVITTQLVAGTYYVVVDGWGGRQDGTSHDLQVDCPVGCATSVTATTWGSVKASHRTP